MERGEKSRNLRRPIARWCRSRRVCCIWSGCHSCESDQVGKYLEVGRWSWNVRIQRLPPKVTTPASSFSISFRQANFVLQVWDDGTSSSCYRKNWVSWVRCTAQPPCYKIPQQNVQLVHFFSRSLHFFPNLIGHMDLIWTYCTYCVTEFLCIFRLSKGLVST